MPEKPEKITSLVPSICVRRAWEESGEQDTEILFNGLAGVPVGMDGERRRLFGCLRCGIELRYSDATGEVTGPDCQQERPGTTVIDLFAEINGADDFLARTAAPSKTAIEAAIDAHRGTPVYAHYVEPPSADKWAGQPNSAL
jgi:hypothetical protein